MKIYLASSWKNREAVRRAADALTACGHEVYDFTDSERRKHMVPPEAVSEPWDAEGSYWAYLSKDCWVRAVNENREALNDCDAVVLLLPCGNDAHADWAYG